MSDNNGKIDNVDLRDLVNSDINQVKTLIQGKIDVLDTLIKANDKRYKDKFFSQDKAVKEAFNASQQAITKSEIGAEKRSDAVYVSIAELQKALGSVIGRSEYDSNHKSLSEKTEVQIKSINDKIDILNGHNIKKQSEKEGVGVGWSWAVAIVSFVIAVLVLIDKFFK